ncbi:MULTISPECIES: cytochrome b/b6 domain-containing protein [Mesorhizobium]|nr:MULTISPECIES: cytochrome b/b6 domain-containing protein [Mesorhizobium]
MSASDRSAVCVWTVPVRLFHWSLAASVIIAWAISETSRPLHEYAGYAAAGLILWRLAAGVVGGHYTRFSQFVRAPSAIASYVMDIFLGRERRYIGHNPAGGAMVITLLTLVGLIALTGWMQTTDTYWGVAWVESTHKFLGNVIVAFVGLHVAGVILASFRHHENLVGSMISGRKRAPSADDAA